MSAFRFLYSCCCLNHKDIHNSKEDVIVPIAINKKESLNINGKKEELSIDYQRNNSLNDNDEDFDHHLIENVHLEKKLSINTSQKLQICPTKTSKQTPNKTTFSNDESFLDYVNSYRIITNDEIQRYPVLIIEEEKGNLLPQKKQYINAGGLVGGRNAYDGVAIFGKSIEIKNKLNGSEPFKCDIELNYDRSMGYYPYVFAIYFQREKKQYFLRGYNAKASSNKLLFVQLTAKYHYEIHNREIISIGNLLFQVHPHGESIEIYNLNKDRNEEIHQVKTIFEASQKIITIGRDSKCDIAYKNEKGFSKIQTTILFDEHKKSWYIIDGCKEKPSLNGTWLYAMHSFPIFNGMSFEALGSRIKCTYQIDKKIKK